MSIGTRDHHWLSITHSARVLDLSRSSADVLRERFSGPDRLSELPPFRTLTNHSAPNWHTNMTLWEIHPGSDPILRRFFKYEWTVNHAIFSERRGTLLLCRADAVEERDLSGRLVASVSDPWMAGAHTIFDNSAAGGWVVSCAASDAVLVLDGALNVVDSSRIPTTGGANYALKRTDDVRTHYIPTDLQIGHLNCAFPQGRRLLWTSFIDGCIIETSLCPLGQDPRTIAHGFIGCHGARFTHDQSGIYFADTPAGSAVWLDSSGNEVLRYNTGSVWLHDVQQVEGSIYALADSEANCLRIVDIDQEAEIGSIDLSPFGATALLLAGGRRTGNRSSDSAWAVGP